MARCRGFGADTPAEHRCRAAEPRGQWLLSFGAVLLVLLMLMPPDGVLSDNEENYFALAFRWFQGDHPPDSAVFDASPHRMLHEVLLGALISTLGYQVTQVVARLAASLCYAVLLTALFRKFRLSVLDGVIVLMLFALLGQTLFGGEWLFSGYESKVAAYCAVLAGFLLAQAGRLWWSVALFVLAAWLHFLVGGFWFAATMALLLLQDFGVRRIGFVVAAFTGALAPLIGIVAWTRLGENRTPPAGGMPAPDYLYSIIREPHHQAPFLTWDYFTAHWLAGYLLAAVMLAGCILVVRRGTDTQLRVIALWLAGLLAGLFLVLVPVWFDRHTGSLGKFYPFRPASLVLLMWLVLLMACVMPSDPRRALALRLALFVVVAPGFTAVAPMAALRAFAAHRQHVAREAALAAALQQVSSPQDVVLIDPRIEADFLDFERIAGRPSLVAWKFMPTNDREIMEWWRRMEFRRLLFATACAEARLYRVDLLLTTRDRAAALSTCGPAVWRDERLALLRRPQR